MGSLAIELRHRRGEGGLLGDERCGQLLERSVGAGVAVDAAGDAAQGVAGGIEVTEAVEADGLGSGAGGMDGGHGTVDVAVTRLGIVGGMAVVGPGQGAAIGFEHAVAVADGEERSRMYALLHLGEPQAQDDLHLLADDEVADEQALDARHATTPFASRSGGRAAAGRLPQAVRPVRPSHTLIE